MSAKVVRDGKVAVLVSPGYGAGWSTWGTEEACFWPEWVTWVEAGKPEDAMPSAPEGFYTGGADQLEIEWVPEGQGFRINEYDGSESLELEEGYRWTRA